MSGHKHATVTLSPSEYRKLHNAEMRLRFMNERNTDALQGVKQEVRKHLRSEMEEMTFRQQSLLDSLSRVNREIGSLEDHTSQAIIAQQAALSQGISEVVDQYHHETDSALASIESQFQAQMQSILARHQQERAWIESEWQRQASGQKQKTILAREWLRTASALDQFIAESYDHNHLSPGSLMRIQTRLVQAQNNLVENMPEAALTAAQEAYNRLSDLRLSLEELQAEYNLLVQRANIQIMKINAAFTAALNIQAMDMDGNLLPIRVTVDYWTEGKLTALKTEFEQVLQQLFDQPAPASRAALVDLLDHYFPEVEKNIDDLVFEARHKVISAQLRVNIADIVVNALATQGYVLENSFFETGDERTAFQADLLNYEGSAITVKVDPVSDEKAANELHLFTSDAQQKTAHELRQRASEIRRALQSTGLDVSSITASQAPEPAVVKPEAHIRKPEPLPAAREKYPTRLAAPRRDRQRGG